MPRVFSYEEFFDPIQKGKFWWVDEPHGLALWLQWGDRRGEHIRIYPGGHAPKNWAERGPVNGWDGNMDAPTLNPSLGVTNAEGGYDFHGFLEAGQLREV